MLPPTTAQKAQSVRTRRGKLAKVTGSSLCPHVWPMQDPGYPQRFPAAPSAQEVNDELASLHDLVTVF